MLTNTALAAVSHTLRFGCWLRIFPYKWDSIKYQLSVPNNRLNTWLFNFHGIYMLILGVIVSLRFILFTRVENVPPQVLILHLLWVLSYILTTVCFIQFWHRKHEIMEFCNLLFKHILESRSGEYKISEY